MSEIRPIDIIAVVLIIGCLTLLALGVDGFIQLILACVVGYYFGRRPELILAIKNGQGKKQINNG